MRRAVEHCAGDDLCEVGGDQPCFLWLYGTTMIEANLDGDSAFSLRAWLVIGPTDRPHWAQRLARWESRVPLGQLRVDGEGDVILAHRIELSWPEAQIHAEVSEFCRHADLLDDRLCAELGGVRSLDQFYKDVIVAIAREALGGEDPSTSEAS